MNDDPPRIAYLTAGAAGMFCGSCMHDNTLATALHRRNVDIALMPIYTPIRTDEDNVSIDHVFFGGLNVYLQQKLPIFRHLPSFLDRLLDRPSLIRWLANGSIETQPEHLGDLTISMLRGEAGFQAKEVRKLTRWLQTEHRPDLINLSNLLVAGCVPTLKRTLQVPIVVTLQGDDIFLDSLPTEYREQAIQHARKLVPDVDAFVVFSQFYAEYMADYFEIPEDKIHQVPLGIKTDDYADPPSKNETTQVIGYLARLAPEKGLHLLVEAFLRLRKQPQHKNLQLRSAGWLGKQNTAYAQEQFARLDAAGLGSEYEYLGTIERQQKLDFLRQLDILSVPTVYHEPKGLFVLEALASGVPVIQPNHGAFPELINNTQGGLLCKPNDADDLAIQLGQLLLDSAQRNRLGTAGRKNVLERFNADQMAAKTLDLYRRLISNRNETIET